MFSLNLRPPASGGNEKTEKTYTLRTFGIQKILWLSLWGKPLKVQRKTVSLSERVPVDATNPQLSNVHP